jgi:hypothetical protein
MTTWGEVSFEMKCRHFVSNCHYLTHVLGVPKYATGIDGNAMLFLQLVEHLIVRSLRLYHAWKQVEFRRRSSRLETS